MSASSPTRIGVAVVEHEGRYLVGIRGSGGPLPGYAEFPGGKCLAGESPAACAIRECLEESGLAVDVVEPLLDRVYEYPHGTVHLFFYRCRPCAHAVIKSAQDAFTWRGLEELALLTFPEANAPLLDRLTGGQLPPRREPPASLM